VADADWQGTLQLYTYLSLFFGSSHESKSTPDPGVAVTLLAPCEETINVYSPDLAAIGPKELQFDYWLGESGFNFY